MLNNNGRATGEHGHVLRIPTPFPIPLSRGIHNIRVLLPPFEGEGRECETTRVTLLRTPPLTLLSRDPNAFLLGLTSKYI